MPFKALGLKEPILSAIDAAGYTEPTPIQAQAIGPILAGKDMLGCAQTGTGKTAAFVLPIIQRLREHPHPKKKQSARNACPIRCLILSPTRELAAQIDESIEVYGKGSDLKHMVIYGGVRQKAQTQALHHGVDIVTATPGRLIDLIHQGHVDLRSIEVFVLDEADRMLDMGFIDDIWQILSYIPEERQSLLFSATMPSKIQSLANAMLLHESVEVRVTPEMPAADTIEQRMYLVEWIHKTDLLKYILETEKVTRVLVFTQTKVRADAVAEELKRAGIKSEVIHSDRPQSARKRALDNFRSGKRNILIASDIAARGLDVDDVSHVVNYELPREAEVYVHRIGRTGRAGALGVAVSFCGVEERLLLSDIEELLGKPVPLIEDHPFASTKPRKIKKEKPAVPDTPAAEKKPGMFSHRLPSRRRKL
jgi:ATP-dependent RNA helicase RhlE